MAGVYRSIKAAHRTIKSRLFCYSLTRKNRSIGFGKYGTGNTGLAISPQFRRRNAESRLAAVGVNEIEAPIRHHRSLGRNRWMTM
jgi:hypothetical protein